MNPNDKIIKPKFGHRLAKNIKDKFRSSNEKKSEPSQEKAHALSSSTVASKKTPPIDRNGSTANEVRKLKLQAKLDLWQEALDEAKRSPDWKKHKREYDEALLECQGNNQNILNKSGTDNKKSTSLADGISEHLISLQEKVLERQWEYRKSSGGESFYFRDVINRIVQWVKIFKDPGNQLAALDPTKAAALVWGFVQFFVERAVVYNEIRDMAIDQEPIANLISRYALIENLYLNGISGTSDEVDEAVKCKIVSLYTAVILYQMAIYNFWKQGKITHGIQSLVPNKLKEMSSSIQKKSAEAEAALLSSDRKVLLKLLEDINLKFQKPITQIGSQIQQVLDVVMNTDKDRSNVLEWVSPILYMDHHHEYKPLDGTGEWILDHSDWNKWRQSQESRLFWLRGKMGAGKSNLVFIIISHLLKICPNDQERTAFFYINNTRRVEDTKSADTILRSLLKQLTIQNNELLLQPVVTKYDELHDVSSLHKGDCITLLTDIISEFRQTNIIIDGFDELEDDDVRNDLLVSLKQIIDGLQGAVAKIFISSRDHVNIRDLLDKTFPHRAEILVAKNNYEDIEKFIESRVHKLEDMLSAPFPEDIRRDMGSILKERSNGMFLWVQLSLKYLIQIKAKSPTTFVEDLKTVPSDLNEAYVKLYKSLLRGQNHERVAIIQRIFCFFLYGCHDEIFEAFAFLSAINYKTTLELSAKDILDLCSTFIELDPETQKFRLIHFSVKEFLQTLEEYRFETGNALIAAHCVSYLNARSGKSLHYYDRYDILRSHARRQIYDFGSYATESWIIHCAQAGSLRQNSPLVEILSEFWPHDGSDKTSPFERWIPPIGFWSQQTHEFLYSIISGGYDSLVLDSKPTAFFLACQYDLREVVENYISSGWDLNSGVPSIRSGLLHACVGGHLELVSYLISQGAKPMLDDDVYESPIFVAIRFERLDILRLFLQNNKMMSVQKILEAALSEAALVVKALLEAARGEIEKRPFVLHLLAIEKVIKVLLDHSSDFEYSDEVQRYMFKVGPKIFQMLLERNPSLSVTINNLKYLFWNSKSFSDAQSYIWSLIPLNPELVVTQSFLIALRYYQGQEPIKLITYILEDLNPSESSVLISDSTLRCAMQNFRNKIPLIKFLFQTNPALRVSDETILWIIGNNYVRHNDVIEILLQHDATIRNFSISDFEMTDNIFTFGDFMASNFMANLLKYCPEVNIDQELFTIAIGATKVSLSGLKLLLSRNPKIELTPQLVENINSHAADQIVGEMIYSGNPEQITDKILAAALGNRFLRCYDHMPSIIVELLSKALDSLELSDDTVYHACESRTWIMEQVLERWPNAPLSEKALIAAMRDVENFKTLTNKRPSIQIPPEVITIVCSKFSDPIMTTNLKEVFRLQPNTIITEEILNAVADYSLTYEEERRQLLIMLLRRAPKVNLTDDAIENIVIAGNPLLQIMLEARPNLELSASCFNDVCSYLSDNQDHQMILVQLLGKLNSTVLDESLMFEIINDRSPTTLMTILSNRPDAVVTENAIKTLLEKMHRWTELVGRRDQMQTALWSKYPGDKAFNILLDRSGLRGYLRQMLFSEFEKLQTKIKEDGDNN